MTGNIDLEKRDAGLRAFSRNDFVMAAILLAPCAAAGDTRSQMLMARMHYAGNGVEKSQEKYLYWLEQAAIGGEKSARAKLKRAQKNNTT